jgi:hypothetical protein
MHATPNIEVQLHEWVDKSNPYFNVWDDLIEDYLPTVATARMLQRLHL